MKKLLALFVTFILFQTASAQFGIINDTDGFVNVRKSDKIENNIIDKLANGSLVYCYETDGNWFNVDYKKNGKNVNGYIHKNRIKNITDFQKVPLLIHSETSAKLENKAVSIEISTSKFNEKDHRLEFNKENPTQLDKIDGSYFFGTDGNIPNTKYESIVIKFKNQEIQVPNSALKNAYEPNLISSKANYDEINDILYLTSTNGDGAGGYEIIWVIENKKFKTSSTAYPF